MSCKPKARILLFTYYLILSCLCLYGIFFYLFMVQSDGFELASAKLLIQELSAITRLICDVVAMLDLKASESQCLDS